MFYSILFNWSNQYKHLYNIQASLKVYYFCYYLISSVNIFEYMNKEIKYSHKLKEYLLKK